MYVKLLEAMFTLGNSNRKVKVYTDNNGKMVKFLNSSGEILMVIPYIELDELMTFIDNLNGG